MSLIKQKARSDGIWRPLVSTDARWFPSKQHWNTVLIDGSVPDQLVREMVEDSYDLVRAGLPKAVRLTLG